MCMARIRKDPAHIRIRMVLQHLYIRKGQVRNRNHSHMQVHYKRGMLPLMVLHQPDTDKLQVSSYL